MLEDEEPGDAGSGSTPFGIPKEVLQILPSNPFEQLDVARRITSIALSTRVSVLESESSDLRASIAEKDVVIAELRSQVESLDDSLSDAVDKLSGANWEKESLLRENASLTSTVNKLQRDVAKLEEFRKKLMQSLQEDEENPVGAGQQIIARPTPSEDDSSSPPSRVSSIRTQASEAEDSASYDQEDDASKSGSSNSLLSASHTSTPRRTPPGSPPSLSTSTSPNTTSRPLFPRRHSVSFSTSRGIFDDRSSISISDAGSLAGRTRVDGKEFFRQVRTRLSYEQFGVFLANVKDLNSHKQTKEETLRKAEEIFGADNKDLYSIFEGLITRNAH